MSSRKKIALIGGGNIGGTLAHLCSIKELGDVVILDRTGTYAQGKALDILQSSSIENRNVNFTGTSNYEDIKDSDVVIITAGIPRKPGMSRDDLLGVNAEVMKSVAEGVKKYSPNAFVVVVTNPVDVMTYTFQKYSGLPTNKVIGMGGILDSGRFCTFLSMALNISPTDIQAMVLGGHGDYMVPLVNYTTVSGISLKQLITKGLITKEVLDAIIQRTRDGGAEIGKLLETASAYYAPASSALLMAESYLKDQKRLLPCSAYINGQYGFKDIYVGVPIIIGAKGVEKIVELDMETEEKKGFDASVDNIKTSIDNLAKLV